MILINFKIYKQSFSEGAVELAKMCQEVSQKTKVEIIPVVSALDGWRIKSEVGGKVFLQNVDEYEEGAKTGQISSVAAKELGLDGSLLNHSECRKKPGTIRKMVKAWPEGLVSVVCLQSLGQAEKWGRKIKADFIAYEPKELIGSKDKSVASEKASVIKKMVKILEPTPVLVGAGIHQAKDVEVSLKMGARGILVASDVVKAEDPRKELLELAEVFRV